MSSRDPPLCAVTPSTWVVWHTASACLFVRVMLAQQVLYQWSHFPSLQTVAFYQNQAFKNLGGAPIPTLNNKYLYP